MLLDFPDLYNESDSCTHYRGLFNYTRTRYIQVYNPARIKVLDFNFHRISTGNLYNWYFRWVDVLYDNTIAGHRRNARNTICCACIGTHRPKDKNSHDPELEQAIAAHMLNWTLPDSCTHTHILETQPCDGLAPVYPSTHWHTPPTHAAVGAGHGVHSAVGTGRMV